MEYCNSLHYIFFDRQIRCIVSISFYLCYRTLLFLFRSTFEFICISLKNFIEKKNTHWRHSVPFRCRVAIALWRVGGGADYRSIREHFGLGKSTVHSVICILCYNNTHFYVDYTLFAVAQQYLRYSCYF